jgi:hypothetical protein
LAIAGYWLYERRRNQKLAEAGSTKD